MATSQKVAGKQAGSPAELPPEDLRPLGQRFRHWLLEDAPSWLLSVVLHVTLMLALGIFFGRTVVRKLLEDTPTFESATTPLEEQVERFEMNKPSADPSVLNTDTLMNMDTPTQDAMAFDNNPVFRENAANSSADGGLSFNLRGDGLGPILRKGSGFGTGRGGSGFGTRGQGTREAMVGRYGGTKETERSVAYALNWLARHQEANGSWSLKGYTAHCNKGDVCSGASQWEARVAGTALGLLPFLAAGQTHKSEGPYKGKIDNAVKWLIQNQASDGSLVSDEYQQTIYSHGLATIALCETYGLSGDPVVKRAAEGAIKYVEFAQNEEGGWRYRPAVKDSDTSVLGWLMMGLKSGMMAGLNIDPAKYENGRKWLDAAHSGNRHTLEMGRWGYRGEGNQETEPSPCMTAVALLTLQYTGSDRNDPRMVAGVKYLIEHSPSSRGERNTYYWYYATQVMHNITGSEWDAWNKAMRKYLTDTQVTTGCAAGSWDPQKPTKDAWGEFGGRVMMTSLSALTLEVYYRYLPLYQLDAPLKK